MNPTTSIVLVLAVILLMLYLFERGKKSSTASSFTKDELQKLLGEGGEKKALEAQYHEAKVRLEVALREREELHKQLSLMKAEEKRREEKQEHALKKLEDARTLLEEERAHVRKKEEEQQEKFLKERDRQWADHELSVLSTLQETARKPEYGFTFYDNTHLPEGFSGTFKPDGLIAFGGLYMIFDAKVSRSENLSTYLSGQVKSTVTKMKGRKDMYPLLFFVVPLFSYNELQKRVFFEQGYTFMVITPEMIPAIFTLLKRLHIASEASSHDPETQSRIIQTLALLDHHIHFRNAADLLLAEHGIEASAEVKKLPSELQDDIKERKEKLRTPGFSTPLMKSLMGNSEEQEEKIAELTEPVAKVKRIREKK